MTGVSPHGVAYRSTNDPTGRHAVSFRKALLEGQAADGGLYLPVSLPRFDRETLESWRELTYPELAAEILSPFVTPDFSPDDLRALSREAYPFDVGLQEVNPTTWLLRLDRGPTGSFKDFGARFMALALERLRHEGEPRTILVATSGDTGSAVGQAFRGRAGIRVIILFPAGEVSPFQKAQLEGIGGNVTAVAIEGKFDDCQRIVKQAFGDGDLGELRLTSANSINIGRLLPQIVYYFYAFLRIDEMDATVAFSVPSGNFGNALGCELARRMGLPVRKLIAAVNGNDEVPRFLLTGEYHRIDPSRNCLSNAMNVGHPSNLARFFDLYGGTLIADGAVVRPPDRAAMVAQIFSPSVSDADTVAAIARAYRESGILLEPHGAVAWQALERYREGGDDGLAFCLETAHPAKFSEIVQQATGITPPMPQALAPAIERPTTTLTMPNDYRSVKSFLMEQS